MLIPRYALSTLDELSVNKYHIRVRDLTRAPAFAAGEAATLPVDYPRDSRVARAVDGSAQNRQDAPPPRTRKQMSQAQMQQPRLVKSPRQALHEPNGREATETDINTLCDATCGGTTGAGSGLVGLNWREYSGDGDANSVGELTMLTLSSVDGGRDELHASACAFQTQHAEDAWLAQLAPSALDAAVALFNENSFGFSATRVRSDQ